MKTLQISDEVYESLKAFVVDPFDDTPNAVLMRLIDIANKAQSRWSPFTPVQKTENQTNSPVQKTDDQAKSVPPGTRIPDAMSEGAAVML